MQNCLDDIIDEDKFYSVIKDRLAEWDGDVESDQFIAVWSAADYRLKYYNTLGNADKRIESIMKLFDDVGFIPQFDVCGPPTVQLWNVKMSPKGDVAASLFDQFNDAHSWRNYLTIYIAGKMRPLMMICTEDTTHFNYEFSNDSRYISVLTDGHVDIWDIYQLKKIMETDLNESTSSMIRWSGDNSKVLIQTDNQKVLLSINGGIRKEITSVNGFASDYALDYDGKNAMFLSTEYIVFTDIERDSAISVKEFPVPFSGHSLSFFHRDGFYIIAGGFVIKANPEEEPVIIKDHREELELSMYSKQSLEAELNTDAHLSVLNPRMDLFDGKVVFDFKTVIGEIHNQCVIDPCDLSYELYSDSMPPEQPEIDLEEPVINDDEIDPKSIIEKGETLDISFGGKIDHPLALYAPDSDNLSAE